MLKRIRIILAVLFFAGITMLFLDFTGVIHKYLYWMASVQALPALLAVNMGVVVGIFLVTLVLGRFYCSIICPLGVMQDGIYGIKRMVNKKYHTKANPNGSKNRKWLRLSVLVIFAVLMVAGANQVAILIAPYSMYGRMASTMLQPVYVALNNLLAGIAEHYGSYAFYSVDTIAKGGVTLAVAVASFLIIAVLAWRGGRTWCNTICPVGSMMGFFAQFSLFKPVIDTTKCNGCTMCARKCKASCINAGEHRIDYSRCVDCMDCVSNCKQGAIEYKFVGWNKKKAEGQDAGRRTFLLSSAAVAAAATLSAQEKEIDGGLAVIEDKKIPTRAIPIKPAGSKSVKDFGQHCTACQLCVSACPNGVLRPSKSLSTLMQPEMSYEQGYCRPECTRCSEVCPTGAISRITPAEKTEYKIGLAVYVPENCVVNRDGVKCGHCASHCPTGAIVMVPKNAGDDPTLPLTAMIPTVDESKCIGCGACENLCPSRPFSAIYVTGREDHI